MKQLSVIVNWGFGLVLLLVSLLAILSSSVTAGGLLLAAALIVIPTSRDFLASRIKTELTPVKRYSAVVVLMIGFAVTIEPNQKEPNSNEIDQDKSIVVAQGGENSDATAQTKSPKKIKKESLVLLEASLNYPQMGTPYSKVPDVCEFTPSASGNEEGHYECSSKLDDRIGTSSGRFVFGPDRKLKARWFNYRTGPDDKTLLSADELLATLDERFGKRAMTQTGSQRFQFGNQSQDVTAVSYGCKAYFYNKPGMYIPGGTPRTHQVIWKETGSVPSLPEAERFDFEVVKAEVQNIEKCVVALVVFGKFNIPTGIDEEQRYSSRVDVMEVDPSFGLLSSKYW